MRRDQSNQAKFIAARERARGLPFVFIQGNEPWLPNKSAYRGGRGFAYNQKFAGEVPGAAGEVCGDGERE